MEHGLVFGRNKFDFFLEWLTDLGGSYVPIFADPDPSPKRTGRRDPDTKPRQYPLNPKVYGEHRDTGMIWRISNFPVKRETP